MGSRPPAGGVLELGSGVAFDRDLVDGVCEGELGQALAYPVRRRAPFGLPELEGRW